ncbi:MAG TPA: phytoene desaturase [Herpetosiphonaceae bacterium]|nr:phytoene desaturase [Herpetosiphonaceae bacterium]
MRIIVIGSGFGGLGAAIRLQTQGHEVTILEKRDKPGGRAYVYEQDGFRFDGGPTVITAPFLIDELFQGAGRVTDDYVKLVPVDPFYRIFFADGTHFDYSGDSERMAAQIEQLNPADVAGYHEFVRWSERVFDKGFTELADVPFSRPWDMIKIIPEMVRLRSYRSVYGFISQFVEDEKLRQILSFHPLLVGGNPFQTTSIYTLIHFLERKWGVWFALGGTGALVSGLVRLFEEIGGVLRLDEEVSEILVEGTRTTGVRLKDGRELPADAVVCNGEIAWAYSNLLPARYRRKYSDYRLARMRYSMSLVVIYFGTDRQYRGGSRPLAHHDIILGTRYKPLLDDIFTGKKLAEDFSLYLHMPTITDPTLAPPGCENFYVLSPVPHLGSGTDWRANARPYRDSIMRFLEENYLPDLSRHIVSEHMITPLHFHETLNSYLGSAFSVEPILTQSAYFRPHNQSEELENLYFVGAGTHPGAGLPGVLSGAKIVEKLITEKLPASAGAAVTASAKA